MIQLRATKKTVTNTTYGENYNTKGRHSVDTYSLSLPYTLRIPLSISQRCLRPTPTVSQFSSASFYPVQYTLYKLHIQLSNSQNEFTQIFVVDFIDRFRLPR